MTVIPYALAGAMLGRRWLKKWYLAFFGGILSHLFLDLVPHWDYSTIRTGAVNTGIAAFLMLGLFLWLKDPGLLWGGIGAMLPDLEVALGALGLSKLSLFFPTHSGALPHFPVSWRWGIPLQVAFSLICLILVLQNGKVGLAR